MPESLIAFGVWAYAMACVGFYLTWVSPGRSGIRYHKHVGGRFNGWPLWEYRKRVVTGMILTPFIVGAVAIFFSR